jgi:predicted acyltransferase
MFALGMLVLGVVEAFAGLFSFLVTMDFFGFTFNGIVFTSFSFCFKADESFVYTPSSPYLGNQNLKTY